MSTKIGRPADLIRLPQATGGDIVVKGDQTKARTTSKEAVRLTRHLGPLIIAVCCVLIFVGRGWRASAKSARSPVWASREATLGYPHSAMEKSAGTPWGTSAFHAGSPLGPATLTRSSVRTGRKMKEKVAVMDDPNELTEPVCQVRSLLEARRGVGKPGLPARGQIVEEFLESPKNR